jgi:hypothetical protein
VTRPAMSKLVRHEARALWPIWAASVVACLAAAIPADSRLVVPGRLAFFVGSVALAAMTIGHEYNHRTLPHLLSLPIARPRILVAKLLAVTPMLATLAVVALTIGPGGPYFERGTVIGGLSILAAVAVAPWLTMVTGSPLAGSVFGLGVAGGLQLLVFVLVGLWLKLAKPVFAEHSDPLQETFDRALAASLVLVAVAAAVSGWRRFMALEASDRRSTHLTWPRWLRSSMVVDAEQLVAPARRSWPYWLLVKKELRIQQLSILVAAINVVIWLVASQLVDPSPAATRVLAVVAMLYGGLLALLIGSLASAEERHMGTLEWQLLMPVAAWRQFALKTVVTLTLSLVLGFALPLVQSGGELTGSADPAAAVLLLTLGGLAVSSRCRSGLQAIVFSGPAVFVLAGAVGWSFEFVDIGREAGISIVVLLAAVVWRFAYLSHRTARR